MGTRRGGGAVFGSRLLAMGSAALVLVALAAHVTTGGEPSHPHNWFTAVVYCLLGERIVAHARRNAVGWLVLAMGVCGAVAVGAAAAPHEPWAAWIGTWSWWPTYSLLPVVLLLFPTGRPPTRRWWPAVAVAAAGVVLPVVGVGWAAWSEPVAFWQQVFGGTARRGVAVVLAWTGFTAFAVALAVAVLSLVVRWFREDGVRRRVLGWAVVGAVLGIPTLALELVSGGAWLAAAMAFPVALVVVITVHDLYDIELIIHRTLLYGLLGALLIGAYTAVVLVTTTSVPTAANALATLVVVVALAPLHALLRRALDRWLFGDRCDPYRALVELGRTLAHPRRPHEVLPAIAASVGEALKLPYVAVRLDGADCRAPDEYGCSRGWEQHEVDLRHSGQRIGVLVAEARGGGERLGSRELGLLDDLAGQAAPAVHSVRLALALRHADARFELKRREDLHRISYDLHDMICPGVVGVQKQVSVVLRTMDGSDEKARRRLGEAVADLETLTGTVRRVARDVQALDLRSGLVNALRGLADRLDGEVAVHVVPRGDLDDVPFPVLRAAYLVISEALTNVVRHAEASECRIDVVRTGTGLEIAVTDDGRGLAPNPVPGIGLESMKERCQDLGGDFTVDCGAPGTRVTARIPFTRG
ncbi:sensor histidine kinase [Umezawaea endophytica]|uniref:histidine kinase n=1 Tax=Umezawaea endophytica TaxID=1654476 RepID=A0A9X2VJY5_9PSEU|nr:ATP-binding protein [Umezawaea endophytica]MCS7477769.1 histidine kinase [Umezawaea endophytica]